MILDIGYVDTGIQGTGYWLQDTEYRIQDTGYGYWILDTRIHEY